MVNNSFIQYRGRTGTSTSDADRCGRQIDFATHEIIDSPQYMGDKATVETLGFFRRIDS